MPPACYGRNETRQRLISSAIVECLVIGCGWPLSVVEDPFFRRFMKILDPKYSNMSRYDHSLDVNLKSAIDYRLSMIPILSKLFQICRPNSAR